MIKLPAAPAASVPPANGAGGLPPPAANGAATAEAVPANAAPDGAVAGSGMAGALLDAAGAIAPAPFGALLDAMAGKAADDEGGPAQPADDKTAAAQAVATMLPAMGNLPLAGAAPGATPDSVAAVAAALTAPAGKPSAASSALLLRQQAQAGALAAREAGAQAEAAQLPQAPLLDARAAMLAAAARPVGGPAAVPAQSGSTPAAATRSSASEALTAALGALQGQAADSSAAPLAAKDSASLLADSQRQPADAGILPGFRSVLANGAPQAGEALQLSGSPEQWQQPLRAALGDRLQLQLARNDERAVIRLEPPNMGSVEISVRHSGGALQINISASHSEVLRQLNTIGDTVRQDLSQRQFGEVAVTVSASNARSLADGGQQQRQQEAQQQREQQRQPGRALEDGDAGATTFAMLGERE